MKHFVTIAAAAACLTLPQAAHAAPVLHLEDLRKSVSISAPQLSPDGKSVAFYRVTNDYEKDRQHADLVLVDVHSRAMRTLVRDTAARGFAWSPNGDAIAYIGTPPGTEEAAQIFLLPMNGGEAEQVTKVKNGTDAFEWRPDGGAFAFSSHIDAPNAAAIKEHADAFNNDDDAWTTQAASTPEYLYEIARHGGDTHRIGTGSWGLGGSFTYAGDGHSLFATRVTPGSTASHYMQRQIVNVRVSDGVLHVLASGQAPLRSRDGRHIAYFDGNPHGTMQTEAYLGDAAGMHASMISTRLDRNISDAQFVPGGDLLVVANDATTSSLFRISPTGAVHRYALGDIAPGAGSTSVASDGTIAFTAGTPSHPRELYVLRPGTSSPQRLTGLNDWIRGYHLGSTKAINWRTADGQLADGVITAPPDAQHGKNYPLVLMIHGGPTSASLTAYSGFAQLLAAHGWYVFQPNYRGSDNLGLKFAKTTVPHIASVPGDDIERGLATVLKHYPIDTARIAVSGWSEGGLMTSWLITHDTRWKAAVSGAAVNDWTGYSAMTDAQDFTPQFIGQSPWTNPSLLDEFNAESPLTYADRVKTPTLILSDAGDFRVPTPLAYAFYHAIRATGTPVQFVVYPVNGHFPSDPIRAEDVYRRWSAFIAQNL